jgi:hypothetical protein
MNNIEKDDDMIPFDEIIKIKKDDMRNLITETELDEENNLLYQVVESSVKNKICIREVGYYDETQKKPSLSLYKNHDDKTKIETEFISFVYTKDELDLCHDKFGMISLVVRGASKNIISEYSFVFVPDNKYNIRVTKRCDKKEHLIDGKFIIFDEMNNKEIKSFENPSSGHNMMCELIKSCDLSNMS